MMQLLIAVVQDEDADKLADRLRQDGFRLTRLNSAGGFLAQGNATMLIGVEDADVERALDAVRATCQTRRSYINPVPWHMGPTHPSLAVPPPLEIEIGGATVFVFPVRQFIQLQGGPTGEGETKEIEMEPSSGATPMDLVLAIVQSEDADPVTQALIEAGYRLTRLNTAGGFLRRGNATLLIGVERERQDHVRQIIQDNCRYRAEARPPESGMPTYSATLFVLETAGFIRI